MEKDLKVELFAKSIILRQILAAAQNVLDNWEHGDLAGAVRELQAAIGKAEDR